MPRFYLTASDTVKSRTESLRFEIEKTGCVLFKGGDAAANAWDFLRDQPVIMIKFLKCLHSKGV